MRLSETERLVEALGSQDWSNWAEAMAGLEELAHEATPALIAVAMLVAFVVVASVGRGERIAFSDRFPPISDDEFLARCRPGTNPVVALKVRRIDSVQMGVDYERIYPSPRFVEDLGAD